jgi:hypothetical protein
MNNVEGSLKKKKERKKREKTKSRMLQPFFLRQPAGKKLPACLKESSHVPLGDCGE